MTITWPTRAWREQKQDEALELQSGKISPDECCMEELYPDEFIERTEAALHEFLAELDQAKLAADDWSKVTDSIKNIVIKLNKINEDFDGSVIETGEREELCLFIDEAIELKGFDIDALAQFLECDRYEITDAWRDW